MKMAIGKTLSRDTATKKKVVKKKATKKKATKKRLCQKSYTVQRNGKDEIFVFTPFESEAFIEINCHPLLIFDNRLTPMQKVLWLHFRFRFMGYTDPDLSFPTLDEALSLGEPDLDHIDRDIAVLESYGFLEVNGNRYTECNKIYAKDAGMAYCEENGVLKKEVEDFVNDPGMAAMYYRLTRFRTMTGDDSDYDGAFFEKC